ncbi:4-alpha-glucanotransferase [candidate division KSB1 bacterium]|nr:4-alpha-glucanotransferase [candidate division KSB1 bacterium]NIR72236.1 4-alpha-glucanotransferase [candidate division KSB1 bacterium]NIS26302.1 4-alpha-glucanotransferase [candidate division KSB1 bacterium]NIT73065.1 4-alpha-glucanotransferase [candidate division KSB1 bacterium]NIU26972.1 4-alpha-glucanotransferase [candidate division KSB1 bacterium]
MTRRGSGILLHITSLPSPYGIGDLGPGAKKFADFLYETRQSYWQILPVNPTDAISGHSPYDSLSAFAGNTLLISPELLLEDDFIRKEDLELLPELPNDRVDFDAVMQHKNKLFDRAFERFRDSDNKYEYDKFCLQNSQWLDDFAAFVIFKQHFEGKAWCDWPEEIRDRQPEAIQKLKDELSEPIERKKFLQFIFLKQWMSLKEYCNDLGIQIMGDLPYYQNYDSADVWTNPGLFKLDDQKQPTGVAGVPPDYFSETGQLWGHPVYNWERLKETDYGWWLQRMKRNLSLFDIVRIDHFRGFVSYWEVPAGDETAINGTWVEVPTRDFFETLLKRFPNLPIVAEDLGYITPDVREAIREFSFPGMRLLLFAFDASLPTNAYAPHNHVKNCVVYTGTHDNNTVRGWFDNEASEEDKRRLAKYLGREVSSGNVHWDFIRLAMMSVADLVLLPIQDVLGLGPEARMNRPATTEKNWQWRLLSEQITPEVTDKLREVTTIFGRA